MSQTNSTQHFVVTTYTDDEKELRQLVWDPSEPMTLGHPFKWVIERTDDSFRVRDLSSPLNETSSSSSKDFKGKDFENGKIVTLKSSKTPGEKESDSLKISIRPTLPIAPAYTTGNSQSTVKNAEVKIYSCVDNWIQDVHTLEENSFEARNETDLFFKITKKPSHFELKSLSDQIKFSTDDSKYKQLKKSEGVQISNHEIADLTIQSEHLTWRFNLSKTPKIADADPKRKDGEAAWFRKSLLTVGSLATALLLLTMFLPKQKPEEKELVPAQFAKIVMTKPKHEEAAPANTSPDAPEKVTKANDAAVVQAFRAKALQNAVKGLLKGGMSSLLAQSNIVAADRNDILSKTNRSLGGSIDKNLKNARTVKVAAIGGNAIKGKVGYDAGRMAAVSGQGTSFVELDVGGAAVETGLTKDEVGRVIHKHLSEVRYCYESAMVRNPDVQGKLMVDFTIGGAGMVITSAVKTSTLPDPRLDDCILRRLVRWKFPKPKGGVDVAVSYPFIFKTLGR